MADHPAVTARALVQELKTQRDPRSILAAARRIEDPGHAAWAMIRASGDRRLQWQEAERGLRDAAGLIATVVQPSRRVEAWLDALKRLDKWREGSRNQAAGHVKRNVRDAAVDDAGTVPKGRWQHDAIAGMAPRATPDGRERLLRLALHNQGFEAAGAKAVLKAAPDAETDALRAIVARSPDAALRAAVLGSLPDAADEAVAAALAIRDEANRLEALRVHFWRLESPGHIMADVERLRAADMVVADLVRVEGVAAARLDKLRRPEVARDLFAAAVARLADIDDEQRAAKERRKLNQGLQRAGLPVVPGDDDGPGGAAEPAPETPSDPEPQPDPGREPDQKPEPGPAPPRSTTAPSAPATPAAGSRHTLALVNGYSGGLGPNHVRSVARAAPLCTAFDLDLLLVDFPADDVNALAELVHAETRVGEGDHARDLAAAGRLAMRKWHDDAAWPGKLVATTPRPAQDKRTGELAGRTCLLMGLGHRGLPRHVLDGAPAHYEITGHNVSLETATAMGILCERLRRTPQSA